MALDDWDQNRTEAPTQQRREQARQQGQVAFSAELTTALMLLTGLLLLMHLGPTLGQGLTEIVRENLRKQTTSELGPSEAQHQLITIFQRGFDLLGWILGGLVLAAVAVTVPQVGFHLVPSLLSANLERLSPANGWTRLLSLAGFVRGLLAVFRVVVVAGAVYLVIRGRLGLFANLGEMRLSEALSQGWSVVLFAVLAAVGALAVLGAMDYGWQRWRHEQSLRMTREELKDELKKEEGDPQIKARVRRLQREAARQRMYQDVPKATVVVTNPTHLAVALSYERGSTSAPRVVAKGAGVAAKRIVEIARRHAVPVVERKPVAQALYKAVRIGQEIPLALYHLVAEVLAYVYRLRGHVA